MVKKTFKGRPRPPGKLEGEVSLSKQSKKMRAITSFLILLGVVAAQLVCGVATAADSNSGKAAPESSFSSDPEDPSSMLGHIDQRRAQRDALFPVSPLKSLHDITDKAKDNFYESTNIKLGLMINHVFQGITEHLPDKDDWGTTTDMDLVASWELYKRGQASQGQIYFHLEGRWDYGTTGPQDLGFVSLRSQIGTANAFSKYTPAFLIRNLYWQQGGIEAGWAYRIGYITPDATLSTSKHITPVTTFLPNGGTGFFSDAFPDSGFGAVGVYHFNDRLKLMGLVSDANADRNNWGDIDEGDLYTAIELAAKIAPKTEKAEYSKLTFWHNDGTEDGSAINASTGEDGWGYTIKYEQELSGDGNAVGILRWGQSYDDSALYTKQAGLNFLYYDPKLIGHVKNDVVGLGVNWVEPTVEGSRDEYNYEIFYRLPLFPGLDMTLSYQYVDNPALTEEIDDASVFSLRLRAVF